jgi:DNA mismatch repair protein MutS
MSTPTPLIQQYFAIKAEHPESLLFFQVGDFYELFFEDAKTAATVLGIALTKRGTNNGEPIPLCGVPLHALDHYLPKLVRAGFTIALCDQLEQAVPGKMVVPFHHTPMAGVFFSENFFPRSCLQLRCQPVPLNHWIQS